jgi:hypothetical protein
LVGLGTPKNDGGKLVWQIMDNDAAGGAGMIYKRLAQPEMVQFLTQG